MAEAVTTRRFTPEAGCSRCTTLDMARRHAKAIHDRSAETDARVLIRQHMHRDHGTVLEVGWT
ncbi:hypothetical protein CP973_01570 [Streptomyces albofaciens JCM 4342]|uniref:hypothetical protein n=1 Tax=Streptomyces albofaciens TaxID=66866 RepID=UPI0012397228|nr:hypothetical protein [Streptomyces albofaciens]KAA6220846.1 hypothetical protein CP973_01570 [Streptomyces albofaciens JCM 4342]